MIKFALYAVSMFFVEVTYDAKDNRITGINSFIGGNLWTCIVMFLRRFD